MQQIIFNCQTITPMFLAGADGTTPELRPPSIKGALRFWWRATNGHLRLEEMRTQEGAIFGDTTQRSSFSIKTTHPKFNLVSEKPVPRNGKHFTKPAIPIGAEFDLTLSTFKQKIVINKDNKLIEIFNFDKLKQLTVTTLLLGGIGFRSRRGFGSLIIKENQTLKFGNLSSIEKFINEIPTLQSSTINYPFIKEINIGKQYKNERVLLEKIAESAHYNDGRATGYASSDKDDARFASPIIVSIVKVQNEEFYPIITTLNTAPKNPINDLSKQDLFKNSIL